MPRGGGITRQTIQEEPLLLQDYMSTLQNNNWGLSGNLLSQESPQWKSRNPYVVPTSFTESIQSNQKAARQESWIHENNYRVPNHEIVLRFFIILTVDIIRKNWKRLQRNLKQAGIIYAAVIELTDGSDGKPNGTVHYHFLIETSLDRKTLKDVMKTICLKSKLGIYGLEFDLIFPNGGITNWGPSKINYFTKFNYPDKVRLFRVGLRLKKFYYSSDWFIEADGTPTKRTIILNRLKNEYKKKKGQVQVVLSAAACPILARYDGSVSQ